MGLASKRRAGGGNGGPPRAKSGSRVKEKRYDDVRDRKSRPRRVQSTSPNPGDYNAKRKRFLDPATLAQGMTARGIGAKIQLSSLSHDEIERDLRHMEAYANACTAYSQQFFIYHNRSLVQSGHFGPVTAPTVVATEQYVNGNGDDPYRRAMPVRIDPEEEKRVSLLRKRIATSETQREILETEYMSLRAHYVYESQRLRRSRHAADGQLKALQDLVKSRGTVVALRRVRCAVARDILKALDKRNVAMTEGKNLSLETTPGVPDILDVWNEIEEKLQEAERSCRCVPIPEILALLKNDTKGKKKKEKKQPAGDDEEERIVPWDCRSMPGAPEGVSTLLSQMSSNPERTAAFSCGGMFGSKEASMCWDTSSLPSSYDTMGAEREDLLRLREEAQFLQDELEKERAGNKDLQKNIIGKRVRNDEMCAMMTLLRTETEAVLMRHNVLLDTREAKLAAQELHSKAVEARDKRADAMAELVDEDKRETVESVEATFAQTGGKHEPILHEEDENDGDDEGEMDEDDDEDGEIHDEPPNEVVIKTTDDIQEDLTPNP
mmetsp:Transcript_3346/g.5487  ORF Transcript_3346/g.5487 Transcript_3346/m.5487 type:complete len:550 (+) Transcript_3346:153-1802(+)|eukprot:CAMPEP_0119010258 /NCGR_PEP_ID=MMETSP1176-20130426/4884_1 /TAXON_ID=265551 /ORGANISM="Synedropsis recta cf, Strain CCMP1620" /LENGTH=549 /DNA_ID=CAMNT_0006962887 /DNA_START=127 /DNA_END=1776 /DNA_ORIENTATION=-